MTVDESFCAKMVGRCYSSHLNVVDCILCTTAKCRGCTIKNKEQKLWCVYSFIFNDIATSQLLSLPITMHEIFSKKMMYHYPGQMTVSGGGVLLLNTNCEFRVKTVPVPSVGVVIVDSEN